jgi:hypothetical protein
LQSVEHLPAAASDKVELVGLASSSPAGRYGGASRVFATLGLQLERVRAAQARGTRVEVWFQDEARIGQKNSLTRVWGQTGSRPAAPKDLGFASAYVFGAVCPSQGKDAALIMPICNTAAMNHHLSEISSQVAAPRFREGRLCPCRGDSRSCRLAPQPSAAWCPAISLCWSCRRTARNSIRSSGFGIICAAIGSPTRCLSAWQTSWMPARWPGTGSPPTTA